MADLIITARRKGDSGEYTPLASHGLAVQSRLLSNDGSAAPSWVQEIDITAGCTFEGVIRIALPVGDRTRFFLPGFMYGTNRGEAPLVVDSKCPRLRAEENFPAAPWWMVRSDRLSHPCAFAFGGGKLEGFAASPYYVRREDGRAPWQSGIHGDFDQYCGFGCSLAPGELVYTLGYENAPWFFLDAHQYFPRAPLDVNCFTLAQGESITVRLYRFDFPAEDERTLHDALKWVYGCFHESPARKCSVQETVASIAGAIAQDAWPPEQHAYSGFVFDRGDHFDYNPMPSISWTSGLSAAVPMLLSAHRLKDETMRAQTLDCIDHIVRHSMNEQSGLPWLVEQDGGWSNRGWWYERLCTPGHAAYLVGQSVFLILKAYGQEKKRGIIREDWLDFCRQVIQRTEQTRNSDGEYPYVLSEKTGAGLEYDSFSGAWCMAAAAYYSFLTGDRTYLPNLLHSEKWYHDAYIRH